MDRKKAYAFGVVLLLAGAALLAWPFIQYGYGQVQQARLQEEFSTASASSHSDTSRPAFEPTKDLRFAPPDIEPKDKGPFMLTIDKIDLSTALVFGVELEDLAKAPGIYPQSVMPGQKGNFSVAGHRTTYGAWFRRLHELEEGDLITVESPRAEYIYEVESVFEVDKYAWEVIEHTPDATMTLTSCHPVGSAEQRLVVRAIYVETRYLTKEEFLERTTRSE